PYQTACGIADMMVHIMERYFTNTPHVEVSDRLCEGVLTAIIHEAPKVMRQPDDYEARANIMWCGTIAHNGTCGVGREEDWASHFMEHEVSALYDVTHGAGLAVIVPAWMAFVTKRNPGKVAQFATRVFNVPQSEDLTATAMEGVERLKAFFHGIGLPTNFRELGLPHPDIDRLVERLHRNKGELVGFYVRLSAEDTREIYQSAL
ncbi:MAG: iron-containing alcohol dehydrogenase, partial [Prevotellaceae bacterium]|nr:iron-containing alcohol dehydrogenase [Prevotellaceae bacterium]